MITVAPKILEALDLESLSREEQEAVLLDLHELIVRGSLVRIMEQLDEATKSDLEQLLAGDASGEELDAFMRDRVPGADAAVTETVAELSDDILSLTDSN